MPDAIRVASLRVASLADVPQILALERESPHAAHWTAQQYERLIGAGIVLVAEAVGQLCGFICAQLVAGDWEIENVLVGNGFLRIGIGSRLVQELVQRARREGVSAIRLEVRESNLAARQLYRKHDFREVGRRRNYYSRPVEDAILYDCRLSDCRLSR
jgi:[ribosomal protein S18]-alanine N-acetyltransferase